MVHLLGFWADLLSGVKLEAFIFDVFPMSSRIVRRLSPLPDSMLDLLNHVGYFNLSCMSFCISIRSIRRPWTLISLIHFASSCWGNHGDLPRRRVCTSQECTRNAVRQWGTWCMHCINSFQHSQTNPADFSSAVCFTSIFHTNTCTFLDVCLRIMRIMYHLNHSKSRLN